jgi:hypothetical protein
MREKNQKTEREGRFAGKKRPGYTDLLSPEHFTLEMPCKDLPRKSLP